MRPVCASHSEALIVTIGRRSWAPRMIYLPPVSLLWGSSLHIRLALLIAAAVGRRPPLRFHVSGQSISASPAQSQRTPLPVRTKLGRAVGCFRWREELFDPDPRSVLGAASDHDRAQ